MRYIKLFLIAGVVICVAIAGSNVEAINFTINYDASFDTAQKQDALQYAADIWGSILIESYTGETITINASFDSTLPSNALASTIPYSAEFDPNLNHDLGTFFGSDYYFYPTALANHLDGQDRNDAAPEIDMKFNPDPTSMGGTIDTPWYFGTDGITPDGNFDFVTNALHEITHGLGMLSGMNGDGSMDFSIPSGDFAGIPTGYIYDAFVFDETTQKALAFLTPTERAALLATGDLRFVGASATAANGGVTPSLFVKNPFRPGSSVVHLDPIIHSGDLMGPNLGVGLFGTNHTPSAIDIGILRGVGWTTEQDSPAPIPEPATILLLGSGLAGLLVGRRRFRRS
jgi:hypothetical protein